MTVINSPLPGSPWEERVGESTRASAWGRAVHSVPGPFTAIGGHSRRLNVKGTVENSSGRPARVEWSTHLTSPDPLPFPLPSPISLTPFTVWGEGSGH